MSLPIASGSSSTVKSPTSIQSETPTLQSSSLYIPVPTPPNAKAVAAKKECADEAISEQLKHMDAQAVGEVEAGIVHSSSIESQEQDPIYIAKRQYSANMAELTAGHYYHFAQQQEIASQKQAQLDRIDGWRKKTSSSSNKK